MSPRLGPLHQAASKGPEVGRISTSRICLRTNGSSSHCSSERTSLSSRPVAAYRRLVQAYGLWRFPTFITCAMGVWRSPTKMLGDGPVELVYAPQWINNLELAWGNPLFARFLNRLGSFARVVFVDRRGMGLSDRLSATDAPPLGDVDGGSSSRHRLGGVQAARALWRLGRGLHLRALCGNPPRSDVCTDRVRPGSWGTASSDYPWAWTAEEWEVYLAEMDAGWGTGQD